VAFGLLTGSLLVVSVALVWFAHVGFDRIVGFGLKYPTGFSDNPDNLVMMQQPDPLSSNPSEQRTLVQCRYDLLLLFCSIVSQPLPLQGSGRNAVNR
jgi:hypothetical protein